MEDDRATATNMKTYKAPWGRTLAVTSIIVTVLCVGASVMTLVFPHDLNPALIASGLLPVGILLGCLPFVVRSYTITEDAVLIRRLWWDTRLERAGLKSAEVVPKAMRGSIRTCGNGGCYSFTGWYWNRKLGFYRAWVTDLKRTVVLGFSSRRVVISPDDPEDFVKTLGMDRESPDSLGQEMCA